MDDTTTRHKAVVIAPLLIGPDSEDSNGQREAMYMICSPFAICSSRGRGDCPTNSDSTGGGVVAWASTGGGDTGPHFRRERARFDIPEMSHRFSFALR